MRKIFAILLSSFLFINFMFAYNCGTIGDRTESLNLKIDNYKYQEQILEYRSNNINSQYEADILLGDIEALQSVSAQLKKELSDLQYEINRCNTQKEKIANYLKDAGIYESKMRNITSVEEFNESYLDKAIEYYTNAYNLMKGDSRLSAGMDDKIKDKIDELESLKSQYQELVEYSTNISNVVDNSVTTIKSYSSKNDELIDTIQWMYNKNLTVFNDPVSFMADNGLRRDEASKFFVRYAEDILGMTPDYSKTDCEFKDLNKAWPDLKDIVVEACQLGLFQGYKGNFMPTDKLTNAQAITVFMRLIDGYKDESGDHFANEYYKIARESGLLKGLNLENRAYFDRETTRGEVAIMLYRGQNTGE